MDQHARLRDDFESPRCVAQAGADDELAAGGDAGGGELEEGFLFGRGEKLEDVEDADISRVVGQAAAGVVAWRMTRSVARGGDGGAVGGIDFPGIVVETRGSEPRCLRLAR